MSATKWVELEQRSAFIDKERQYWRIPGLAVVLIQPRGPDQILCLGWRDAEKKLLVNAETQFCIASCSKSMTVAMLARLADAGNLDFDIPVRAYAPDLLMKDEEAAEKMTLRDILCHRTGLGGHDALWPGQMTRNELARRIRYLEPNMKFREKAQYSNLLYAMAGYVGEKVMGQSWRELMATWLFEPLHLTRTSCMAEEITSERNHAEPYQVADGKLEKLPFWNVDLAGPAASVNMAPVDMAKWLHFHLDGGRNTEGVQLIGKDLFAQMHEQQIAYCDSADLPEDCFPGTGYGLGWICGSYRGHPMQKHSGKIEGYSTLQVYLPEEKVGVGLMMNLHCPSTPIFYTVLYTLLDQVLGYEDAHWENRFHGKEALAPIDEYDCCAVDITKDYLDEAQKGKSMGGTLSSYTGQFLNAGYGLVTVQEKEKGLQLHYRDQILPLQHWGGDIFWMDGVKEDIWKMKMPVVAVRTGGGQVEKLQIPYEPMIGAIEFSRV